MLLAGFIIRTKKYILLFTRVFSEELNLRCWTLNEILLFYFVPIDHIQYTLHLSRRPLTSELQASYLNDKRTDVHVGSAGNKIST